MRSDYAKKNIFWAIIQQIVSICFGILIPSLIISKYGSNTYGLITSITSFLSYITLLESGIGAVFRAEIMKPICDNDREKTINVIVAAQSFFKKIGIIFVIYVFALCFVYPMIINDQFDSIFTILLIVILSIGMFIEYYYALVYKFYLQTKQKSYIVSLFSSLTIFLTSSITIVLVLMNQNIIIVKLIAAITSLLLPFLMILYIRKKEKIDIKECTRKEKLNGKWDGLAQHIALVVNNNTDVVVLTLFSTLKNVSVYSIYYLIVSNIRNIVISFTSGIDVSFGDMYLKKEYDTLKRSFNLYEIIYFTMTTILFICTFFLILPFIKVYTLNLTDAYYINETFGYLFVLAYFVYCIRMPYYSLSLIVGHFKETRNGAFLEAGLNIFISTVLVIRYGLVGVAIGTLVAMLVRTIELIIHCYRKILDIPLKNLIFKIIVIVLEFVCIYILINNIITFETINYIGWFIYAIKVFLIVIIVVFIGNLLAYRNHINSIFNLLKNKK